MIKFRHFCVQKGKIMDWQLYIYILDVFSEKPRIKPLECSSNNNTEPIKDNDKIFHKFTNKSRKSESDLAINMSRSTQGYQ